MKLFMKIQHDNENYRQNVLAYTEFMKWESALNS